MGYINNYGIVPWGDFPVMCRLSVLIFCFTNLFRKIQLAR